MQEVKIGSNWTGSTFSEKFTVIHRIEIENNVWIHYRDQQGREYSCYEEAFLIRFKESCNEQR